MQAAAFRESILRRYKESSTFTPETLLPRYAGAF